MMVLSATCSSSLPVHVTNLCGPRCAADVRTGTVLIHVPGTRYGYSDLCYSTVRPVPHSSLQIQKFIQDHNMHSS
jgi:hypothetical protein